MQVAAPQGIKIYNVSAGKSLEDWILANRNADVKQKSHDPSRLDLIQDFHFTTLATHVKVTKDNNYIIAAGLYPPLIRVFDVKDLSLKFERGLECEVVGFEVLSEDYSKMVVARADRNVEFHVKGGKLHTTRLPKPFRDMTYHTASCDMLFACSSNEVYRINLDQGRFLAPYETKRPGINCIVRNPIHNLMAMGGEDGVVEFWDPRVRSRVATLNTGISEVFTGAYDDDGLSLVLGGSEGNVHLYDIRSVLPLIQKQHQNELPIIFTDFHSDGGLKRVASADAKSLKVWEKKTGKHFISIEPAHDIKTVCMNKGTGLIFFAVDDPKIQSYYVPALGPAPKWCAFLDSLTEEMEEEKQVDYSDYKFVTRNELHDFGMDRLIGTRYLKEYMHGFFMDMGLYTKVKAMFEPHNLEAQKKELIHDRITEKTISRISARAKKKAATKGKGDKISALLDEAEPIAESGKGKNAAIAKKQIDKNSQFNDDELLDDFNPVDESDEELDERDEEEDEDEEEEGYGEEEGEEGEGEGEGEDESTSFAALMGRGSKPEASEKKRKFQFYEIKSGHSVPFSKLPKQRNANGETAKTTTTTKKAKNNAATAKEVAFTDRVKSGDNNNHRRPFKPNNKPRR